MDKYNLTYKGVKCTGVEWNEQGNGFYFEYLGKEYRFKQERYVSASADTDHIRIVIDEQFLPWVKEMLTAEQVQKVTAKEILQQINRHIIKATQLNEYAKGYILGFIDLLATKYNVEITKNND